jgi:hypothetical protein
MPQPYAVSIFSIAAIDVDKAIKGVLKAQFSPLLCLKLSSVNVLRWAHSTLAARNPSWDEKNCIGTADPSGNVDHPGI